MSVIQKYKSSGNLLRWWDFRSGTVDDLSGNNDDGAFGGSGDAIFTRNGLDFFQSQSDTLTLDTTISADFTNGFSVMALVRPDSTGDSTHRTIWSQNDSNTMWVLRINSSNKAELWYDSTGSNGNYAGSTTINSGEVATVGATLDDSEGTSFNVFVNGLQDGDGAKAGAYDDPATSGYIGERGTGGQLFSGTIMAVVVFSAELTETEMSELSSELSDQKWPSKPSSKTQAASLIELSDSALVGAWDMTPQGTTIVDLTTNKDGTLTGGAWPKKTILGHALEFDGATGYVAVGNTGQTVKTAAFWVKAKTTTEDFADFDGGTHTIEVAAGTITATGFDTPTIYIDNTAVATGFTADVWHRVVVTTATGFTASNLNWAKETIFLEGEMTAPELWSDEKSADWVANDYKKGASLVGYKTDWGTSVSVANVTAGQLENTGWTVDSGVWKVSTDTINGEKVKVFECVTAGILYLPIDSFITPEDAAFGSCEFFTYKLDANSLQVLFISDTIGTGGDGNDYNFIHRGNEQVDLRIGSSSTPVIDGGSTKYPASTWHKIKITRRYDGLFEMFINGTSLGTGTDATYTTSNYICLDFGAGDKMAIADRKGDKAITKKLGIV